MSDMDEAGEVWIVSEKPEREAAVQREKLIRRGNFLMDFLDRKRAELGVEKFEDQKEKLMREAEAAYERQEREKEERLKKEEEERRRIAEQRAKDRIILAQWESSNRDFLIKQLLTSKTERHRTLREYVFDRCGYANIPRDFFYEFFLLLLEELDRIQGRKLKD